MIVIAHLERIVKACAFLFPVVLGVLMVANQVGRRPLPSRMNGKAHKKNTLFIIPDTGGLSVMTTSWSCKFG
jgi:hypothetical protein